MILLVSGNVRQVATTNPTDVGQLLTPFCRSRILGDRPFAADNGAFAGFDEPAFLRLLGRLEGTSPLFVVAPDVVADARKTLDLFDRWEPVLHARGLPVAFVAQDGQEWFAAPLDRCECLFIGGSTEYKLGKHARWLANKARGNGLLVHMGRVNSMRRLDYAIGIGCTSVDGTGPTRFPQKLFRLAGHIAYRRLQLRLPLEVTGGT